jgi:thiamine kinase-like enzyme
MEGQKMDQNEEDLLKALERIEDWRARKITYEPVTGGITNPNWKVTVDKKQFFIKIPGRGTGSFIDRNNAHIASLIAADEGIGPQVHYYFEDSGVEVFEWLEGYRTLNYGDVFNQEIFFKIIKTLKKFHEHKKICLPVTKNPFDQTYEMMALAKKLGGYLPPEIDKMEWLASRIENSIMTVGIDFVPCHVDHWTANYMYNEKNQDLKLTDFEYASMNDIGWDFAAISTTNYFTEAMDVEWIKAYFGRFDEMQFARFKLYKILSDINWVMWSSVQITQSSVKNFDYYMWLGTKMTRLRQFWQDPRIDYWLNLVKGVPVFSHNKLEAG